MNDDGKRIRPRVDFDYTVMCFKRFDSFGNEKGAFVMKVQVLDISYSGLGIEGNCELSKGDTILLNITHKNKPPMQFTCVAKWCTYCSDELFKAGLEFKDLTREHVYLLDAIIKSRRYYRLNQK